MIPPPSEQCAVCTRFYGVQHVGDAVDELAPTCRAFPTGIPREINLEEHDHRRPFEGDGGVLFDPINEEAEAIVSAMTFERRS